MLILTRRAGESLYLDDNIRITILGVQGKQVKIGLDVPPEMNIYREEVYQRVKEENTLATTINNNDLIAAAQLTNKEEIIIDTRLGQQTIEPEKIINFPRENEESGRGSLRHFRRCPQVTHSDVEAIIG